MNVLARFSCGLFNRRMGSLLHDHVSQSVSERVIFFLERERSSGIRRSRKLFSRQNPRLPSLVNRRAYESQSLLLDLDGRVDLGISHGVVSVLRHLWIV